MPPRIFLRKASILFMLMFTREVFAQSLCGPAPASCTAPTDTTGPSSPGNAASPSTALVTPPPSAAPPQRPHPFSQIGLATQIGIGGPGFDLAASLSRKMDLRAGVNVFSYLTNFQEHGANVGVNLQLLSGHAALDWFPFGGRFRLSPQVYFANNNRAVATVIVPPGNTVSLNGQNYISSPTDPLQGYGRIEFRKVAPGFSIGFGSFIPRGKSGISIPLEIGFYYAGQPSLNVGFTGSACTPAKPSSAGCQPVGQDPGFQRSLAAFIARNNHNLSYASFFPILSVGFAFRLW